MLRKLRAGRRHPLDEPVQSVDRFLCWTAHSVVLIMSMATGTLGVAVLAAGRLVLVVHHVVQNLCLALVGDVLFDIYVLILLPPGVEAPSEVYI